MKLRPLYDVRPIKDLKDMLEQSSELYGDGNAFLVRGSDGDYSGISYSTFKQNVESFGTALLDLGLKGKCIAVIGENRYEWCLAYMAVVCGAGVIVPIDKELPPNEIEFLLGRCNAAAIIFSGKHEKDIVDISTRVTCLKYLINMDLNCDGESVLSLNGLLKRGAELISAGRMDFIEAVIDNNAMSILLFTSGTTGVSKGVMLSHKNLCSNITAVCSTVYIDSNDSSLSILPLHHTYECTIGFLTLIYKGGTIAFCEGLKYIAKNLKEVKPTVLVAVPLILESAYRKIWEQAGKKKGLKTLLGIMLGISNVLRFFRIDIRKKVFKNVHDSLGGRLRLIVSGAAAIDPSVARGFRRFGIPVLQGYGLTECSPLVTGNRDRYWSDASIGIPIPGVEVKVDRPDEKGVGELLVRGENVMLGYYQDEEATGKCMEGGWFHTGDIGKLDKKGYFYITGRSKNVIVTKNGKNIYPEEIEAYINKNPLVSESFVWGKLDRISGETHVNVQIFPNMDAVKERLKQPEITKEQLLGLFREVVKNVNKGIPIYKHIRNLSLRDSEFIKTTTKKIRRFMVDVESNMD